MIKLTWKRILTAVNLLQQFSHLSAKQKCFNDQERPLATKFIQITAIGQFRLENLFHCWSSRDAYTAESWSYSSIRDQLKNIRRATEKSEHRCGKLQMFSWNIPRESQVIPQIVPIGLKRIRLGSKFHKLHLHWWKGLLLQLIPAGPTHPNRMKPAIATWNWISQKEE